MNEDEHQPFSHLQSLFLDLLQMMDVLRELSDMLTILHRPHGLPQIQSVDVSSLETLLLDLEPVFQELTDFVMQRRR